MESGRSKKRRITKDARKVLNKVGKAATELIRKVTRDGMETERINTTEEVYRYNECVILDVSWGQFIEGDIQTKRGRYCISWKRSEQWIAENSPKLR